MELVNLAFDISVFTSVASSDTCLLFMVVELFIVVSVYDKYNHPLTLTPLT